MQSAIARAEVSSADFSAAFVVPFSSFSRPFAAAGADTASHIQRTLCRCAS
jgi:hypothetical protein